MSPRQTIATRRLLQSTSACALMIGAALIVAPQTASAQSWAGTTNSDYTDGRNWTGGSAPTAGSDVVINDTGTNPQPVLAGNGVVAAARNLAVGQVSTGSLTVRDGAVLNVGQNGGAFAMVVGGVSTNSSSAIDSARFANGTLTITGPGSRVNAVSLIMGQGASNRGVAEGGAVGLIEILAGGRLSLSNGLLLGGAGGSGLPPANLGRGTIRVSGAGSTLDSIGENNIRNNSRIEILNGARVLSNAGSNWNVGNANGLLVDGAGTTADFGRSVVTVGSTTPFTSEYFVVQNGATASMNFLQTSGGTAANALAFAVRSGGTINAGSVDLSGPRGRMLVQDATLNVTGALTVGDGFNPNGNSVLQLQNGNVRAASASVIGVGRMIIGGDEGQAATAAGTYNIGSLSLAANARVVFNHIGNPLTFNSSVSGSGLVQHVAGTTVFTGASGNFSGETRLTGGSLLVNGGFGTTGHRMTVSGGSLLGGSGTVRGNVTIADGRIAPGNSAGNLTINGNLALGQTSLLDFELGAPGGVAGVASDLITATGNLTLDGTLNVANTGGFGPGLYRLINYGGTLTDNGLLIGSVPGGFSASDLTVQTSAARQINLLVGTPGATGNFTFWDGANTSSNGVVNGGTGIWNASGTNWTNADGTTNGRYDRNATAIFQGPGGTVTVDNSSAPGVDSPQITLSAPTDIQFASTGYRIEGGTLSFAGGERIATIRVGDGTAAGAAINATIASNLTFVDRIEKTDLGTLTLTGQNLMLPGGGASRVDHGTLEIAGGGQFNTAGLEIALPGQAATFRVTGAGSQSSVGTGIRTGFVNNGPGTVEVLDGGLLRDSAFGGHNFGVGSLVRVSGAGSLIDFGQASISQGSLLVENGGIARVAPFAFTNTGSLIVRSGGRVETLGGNGNWIIKNGLIEGQGTSFSSIRNLSIAPGTPSDPGANLVVEDGATVTVNANTDSGLGFQGPLSTLTLRNGASFTLTGGTNAGLQTENARLTVDNATFNIGGTLLAGQRFGDTTVALRNADFTARSVVLNSATDRMFIGADAGETAGGAGRFNVGTISLNNAATTLVLNHDSTGFEIGSEFQGFGIIRHLAGDTRLTSVSPSGWQGLTQLEGGSLAIDGLLGVAAHRMTVGGGAILSGRGTIGGSVTVGDGTIRPGGDPLGGGETSQALLGGDAIGTLTIGGSLNLGAASRLAFQLGAPTGEAGVASDLITVGGNLVLDGTLNVTDAGGFGEGLYRLINYGGTLTDNGLLIGSVPGGFSASDLAIQTSVARQVNLLVGAPAPTFSSFSFWDGANTTANNAIDGGAGTWTTTGQNWTVSTGEANGVYDPTQLLIFSGTGGIVTVDTVSGAVTVGRGLQFATNGYSVTGGDLTLGTDPVVLRVGDGTAAGAGISATIASNLIGGASIEKTDLGILILTGNVAQTAGTTITNGTLQIGAGGATGSIGGNIVNNGGLVFNRAGTLDYAGIVSGSGTLEQRGPGTLTLSGVQSYTGLTTVSGGTLANTGTVVGATNVLAAGTLTNAGTIGAVANAGTGTNSGTMGALTNTAGSFTNAGTLNGGVVNSAGATFATTATLNGGLTNSGTAFIGGVVNGALDNRAGTVTATAATTGIGALTQAAGASLNVAGFGVTAGSIAGGGTVQLGSGTLTTGGSDASTAFAGIISGAGRLIKQGTGELTLTGANTYMGGTTVSGGTLRGSTVSLTGPMAIGTAGTVQFDQAAEGTFAGVFTGGGLLRKTGTGTLSITGNSADFTGTTRAETGTLNVTGTLGGNVVIQAPATLTGTGRLGALDVAGRVSPGGTIGAFNVTGDVIFRAGSTYAVDLAAAGGTDRILAGGRATLEGGTVAVTTLDPEIDYRDGSVYRILTAAGGVTGTFAGLTETSAFLDFTLGYEPTGALITIKQIRTFPDVAQTFNQRQAASALKVLDRTPGSDALAVYNQILMLDEGSALGAFDASSGEIYASVIDARQRAAMGLAGQFAMRGKASLDEGLGVWGGLTAYDGRVSGDGNGGRIDADTLGAELGVDYRGQGSVWAVGVGGGWQNGDVEVASRASDAEIDSWHLGAYARYGTGAAGFTALVTGVHAQADADVTRRIGFGTVSRTARAEADVQTTALSLDLRYGFGGGKVTFGPTSSIHYASNTLDGFSERGADALALSAGENSDDWTRFGIGGFARATHDAGYIDLSARMVTGHRSNASADLTMAGSTQRFTVRAPRGAATAAEIQVSTAYDLGGNWSLAGQAGYIGGDGNNEVSGNIRIGFRF